MSGYGGRPPSPGYREAARFVRRLADLSQFRQAIRTS